jgi:RimJ/RimL family protein N-acetyltransferase
MEPVITERLVVRRMAETDLEDLLAYHTHPEVLRYLPGAPLDKDGVRRFLARQAAGEIGDEGGYLAFAVEHRGEGRVIGEIGLFLSPKPESKGDIGWIIHPDYQRRGYATEAAPVMLDHGFLTRGLHRITSGCDTQNPASFRVMERLGLRREGHLIQSQSMNGQWHDEYLYALLRDEWLARRSTGA